ncbi:MAG: hypothetical protein ACI9MR_004970, partial [Myxococcota bacterium]
TGTLADTGGAGTDTSTGTDSATGNTDSSDATETGETDATEATDTSDATETGETDTGSGTFCQPGTLSCADLSTPQRCADNGSAWEAQTACTGDERCSSGRCLIACPNDPKFGVFVGCEYWATDLPNYPDPFLSPTPEDLPWALVVSNPRSVATTVGFEMPANVSYSPADPVIPPKSSRVFEMPSLNVQGTSLRPKGVHVVATGPILVHQFNPWDSRFSNDASVLLPDPILGTEYFVLTWPTSPFETIQLPGFPPPPPNQNGYFTVIGAFDNTEVVFQVTGRVVASGPIPDMQAGSIFVTTINRGDVLSIQADPSSIFTAATEGDLTGSRVTSNKPVAVFAGHEEAVIGMPEPDPFPTDPSEDDGNCCADHLEEQMLPTSLLTGNYIAVKSPLRGPANNPEVDYWRIQAVEENVTINTNPPQPGANGVTLARRGDWVEIQSKVSFEINATGRVQVGQYLVSQQVTEDVTGDPSLTLAVPQERFRKDYAFAVPDQGYDALYVSFVKRVGETVTIDDVAVPQGIFSTVGSGGWEAGFVSISPGVHIASGQARFGLYVYGYSNAVSFGYIGGLALPGE